MSTTGATRASHARLPLPMRALYSWLLTQPHVDKAGVERVLAHADGARWDDDGFRADGHRVSNFVAIAEAR